MPELNVTERVRGFAEVETGYTPELAQAEAARCLACGICSECLSCWYQCGVKAIDHDMMGQARQLNVGAIILAPGYQAYRAELSEEYGWGRFPNVITSLQFERLLSASGPTMGHVKRPSDGRRPNKIAFLQCVGSRDQSHDYCSAICCMAASKEAVMAVEHEPDTQVHIFMMDMRAFSKGYEAYYRRARDKYGIQYTRCRISSEKEDPATGNIIVRFSESANQRISKRRFASGGTITVPPANTPGEPDRDSKERVRIKVRIYYMVGNHDWYYHIKGPAYDEVRRMVIAAMGLSNPVNGFAYDLNEDPGLREVLEGYKVYCRHGDYFDHFNFNPKRGRDFSALGDAFTMEVLNRYPVAVQQHFGDSLPKGLIDSLRRLTNVRPALATPLWISSQLKRHAGSDALESELKKVWDDICDSFLQLPVVRAQDKPFVLEGELGLD